VFEKVFGSRRGGLSRDWRKRYSERFYDSYSLPNVIQVQKPRSTRWVANVAHLRQKGYVEVVVG
jgi:hypothetical protein